MAAPNPAMQQMTIPLVAALLATTPTWSDEGQHLAQLRRQAVEHWLSSARQLLDEPGDWEEELAATLRAPPLPIIGMTKVRYVDAGSLPPMPIRFDNEDEAE